jgi:hypothetical protein
MFDATSPRGIHAYWKTEYLDELDAAAIDVLVTHAEMIGLSSLTAIQIHHLEGAIRQQPPGGSAFSHRDLRFVLNHRGQPHRH